MADPHGHEEVDQGGYCAMGDGLEEDPVVEELIFLASSVQLRQLQTLLIAHILEWGWRNSGVWFPRNMHTWHA